ncbi:uncharacterized protein LOC121656920 [Melanotaenia boesemani]|uniref:uncharacterized protein LOC121656920 n=1 Tax=Melanotaenia boesemani TaxID=1250792 RepID=UPI001C050CC3|nr:uncharacterized protein LOC121656920 [Melanotaenia boesemani]
MNLWLSGYLLFAALFLSSSAPTPEECQPLITPLSLADPSVMYGKMHFLVGFTDHEVYKASLKLTDSSWVKITASPSSTTEVIMSQENRMNGICLSSRSNVTIEGNTGGATHTNMSLTFQVLPSCKGCLVFSANSTLKNAKEILQLMQMGSLTEVDEIHGRALYLLANELTLKESDLEHFKKQASCLGFSGDPDYTYNPEKSFCKEGEGIRMPFSH